LHYLKFICATAVNSLDQPGKNKKEFNGIQIDQASHNKFI